MRLRRFARSPKGILIFLFAAMAAAGIWQSGRMVIPEIVAAVVTAALIDAPILRYRKRKWELPDGAILTGLIVAMVLSPFEPWWVVASIAALAVVSKYIFRTRSANIFNPAAFAIVATYFVFKTGQNWWGALPELGWVGLVGLVGSGVFISDRVNKLPLVLAFLGCYYVLFTATAFTGDPAAVAGIFRSPDLQAVLYFAFFILTDPPTSPIGYRDQIIFAVIVALVSFAIFETSGAVYYLLGGVLAGNAWEAFRRVHARHLAAVHKLRHAAAKTAPATPAS